MIHERIFLFETLQNITDISLFILVFSILFFMGKMVHNASLKENNKLFIYIVPWKTLVFTLIFFILYISLRMYIEYKVRTEVINFIYSNENNIKIYCNNEKIDTNSKVLDALTKMKMMFNHHTGGQGEFVLVLKNKNNEYVNLLMKQDSKVLNEYWIFYPYLSMKNEIGRIHTTVFDNYIKRFEKGGHIWYYKHPDRAVEYVRRRGYMTIDEIKNYLKEEK